MMVTPASSEAWMVAIACASVGPALNGERHLAQADGADRAVTDLCARCMVVWTSVGCG